MWVVDDGFLLLLWYVGYCCGELWRFEVGGFFGWGIFGWIICWLGSVIIVVGFFIL